MEQGLALMGGGRFHEAVQQFGVALQQQPAAWEPRVGISQAFTGLRDGWAAVAWLTDACRVAPEREELWLEVLRLLVQLKRDTEVDPLLSTAVAVNPDSIKLLQALADHHLSRKSYSKALASYERLHELLPQDAGVMLNYGYCLEQTAAVDEAVSLYRQAIARRPDFMEAHVDLAGVLWRVEEFDAALVHALKSVELAPTHPFAVRILGTAYLNLNRLQEAEHWLRKSLVLQPGLSLSEIDLAFTLLLAGRLEEGWRQYHLRWNDTDRMKRPGFFQPEVEWKGRELQPLQGKRIAIYAEQGLGDVIQFIRYVADLQRDGATVSCVIQDDLVALVEHSFPGVLCLIPGRTLQAEHHVALLDLPMHYGTTLENIPARVPYLCAPQARHDEWAVRLPPAQGSLRVGLAWSGSQAQVNNVNRAMRLSHLLPVLELPGLQCFSLQKGNVGELTDITPDPLQLPDFTPQWDDFTDSAAMIENLDLVITVDTSIAHLAGAMGKDVWVMLPPNADWRYLLDREDSPWYPSMRLFRRGVGEPRARQVARVVAALEERMAANG